MVKIPWNCRISQEVSTSFMKYIISNDTPMGINIEIILSWFDDEFGIRNIGDISEFIYELRMRGLIYLPKENHIRAAL